VLDEVTPGHRHGQAKQATAGIDGRLERASVTSQAFAQAPASRGDRRTKLALVAVIALHVVLVWSARIPGVLTGEDDAEYILLGHALGEGSYRELWRVDTPLHSQYPPGYPALLALWEVVAGPTQAARLALSAILSVATLLVLYGAIARRLGARIAVAAVVVLAVNPFVVQFGGEVASELPYTFLSVACLYGLIRWEDHRGQDRGGASATWLAAAVVAALGAALVRSAGLSLIAAVILWLALKRQGKAAVVVSLATTVTVVGWLLWTVLAPEQFVGRSYVADMLISPENGYLMTLARRIVRHAWRYVPGGLWAIATPTIQGTVVDNIVSLLVLAVTIPVGLVALWRRWSGAAVYLATYTALILLFAWNQTRFLVPMLPLVVPVILLGGVSLARSFRPRWAPSVLTVLVVLLVWGGSSRSATLVARNSCPRTEGIPVAECTWTPEQEKYFEALRYVQSNLPPGAVILTAKPGPLYYYTGRQSISAEAAARQRPEDFIGWVKGQGAGYVLLSAVHSTEIRFFSRLLQANCERVRLIQSFGPTALLFGLEGEATMTGTDGEACRAIARYHDLVVPKTEIDNRST
jgi:hypothetical protein